MMLIDPLFTIEHLPKLRQTAVIKLGWTCSRSTELSLDIPARNHPSALHYRSTTNYIAWYDSLY